MLIVYDDEGEIQLQVKFEVCPNCEGKGKSSAYLGAFTQSDMDEQGQDFLEDYMSGNYDKTCNQCSGQRVIEVPDPDRNDSRLIALFEEQEDEKYQDYRTRLAESGMYSDDVGYWNN